MNRTLTISQHYLQTKYFRKFKNREQLLTWQNQQVQNFLNKILPQSPFYQQYYQGLDIQDWQNFPIIDKAKMMENFDQLNTVKILASEAFEIAFQAEKTRNFSYNLSGYTVGLSTGTSGNRGLFLVSSQEQWIWAGTILAKFFPDFIRRAIVMVSDDIEDYQVMQLSLNRIEIALKVKNTEKDVIQEDVIKSLKSLFEHLHCHIPEIVFLDQFPSIPKGEKRRRVWQCQKLGF